MIWDGKTYGKYRIEHTDGTPLNKIAYEPANINNKENI